jgi:hypothetical protein
MRLGAGLLAGAGALAVAAAVLVGDPAPQPIAFVEPVAQTVANQPARPETPSSASPVAEPPARIVAPSDTIVPESHSPATLPVSPLAADLPPRESAIPVDTAPVVPAELWIGDLSLWAPIVPVGFEPDGQLEIPDETEVGWYRFGSSPTRPGSTVFAAHVSWNDTVGPFFRLAELEPGARIKVELSDGTARHYQVVERAQYGKSELPAERIWTRSGDEKLVLITCGGEFNRQVRRYSDNIVIYASPI